MGPIERPQGTAVDRISGLDNCEKTSGTQWTAYRFPGRCYFYSGRDCAGYVPGQKCGRVGEVIPLTKEE